ncbi:unnamed protein product [marine sediment metagenome]|uniref:Uncharacterized protein n=1 Tax=marine sediment metagenome TaxID=412755 RepID=X1LB63_9ZZZZ
MTWRLACPACGHYGYVGKVRGGRGKVFACPCGITLYACSKSDLTDKLNRLTKKIHTARVIGKVPQAVRLRHTD